MDALLQPVFWDVSFETLSWRKHRNFIIRRILQSGNLEMVRWLRSRIGDAKLRLWIETHNGAGLTPRQLSYWETVLDISPDLVNQWISNSQNTPWGQRRCTPKD